MTSDDPQPGAHQDPRVRFAAERTLLAWIRTGLAMMGFGFVVAKFGLFLRLVTGEHSGHVPPSRFSTWIGTGLVLLGIVVSLMAAGEHLRFLRRFRQNKPYLEPKRPMEVLVAFVLAGVGGLIVAYLLTATP